jgi:hypothetical protein
MVYKYGVDVFIYYCMKSYYRFWCARARACVCVCVCVCVYFNIYVYIYVCIYGDLQGTVWLLCGKSREILVWLQSPIFIIAQNYWEIDEMTDFAL